MINTLLLIAAIVLLVAIVRIRAYDAGRKVGQHEGFFFAIKMGIEAAEARVESEAKDLHEHRRHAAGVAPWN